MFSNIKSLHLKIAIIVAPLLVIGGWGLAEVFDRSRNPDLYDLRGVHSVCAIMTKACQFEQGKFRARLSAEKQQGLPAYRLRLESADKLDFVLIQIVAKEQEGAPLQMRSKEGRVWRVILPQPVTKSRNITQYLILRMVVSHSGQKYISERPIRFEEIDKENS